MAEIRTYFIFVSFLFVNQNVMGQFINCTGSWFPQITNNVINNAGQNYASSYKLESMNNQATVSLSLGGIPSNYLLSNWRVDVRRSDIRWHSNLQLEIRRTSRGIGSTLSSISSGASYQVVTPNSQSFFQGVGTFSNIGIQYRLSGFSVLIPVDTYSTTVVLTLIDL